MIQALTSMMSHSSFDSLNQISGQMNSAAVQHLPVGAAEEGSSVSFSKILSEIVGAAEMKLQNAESLSIGSLSGSDVGVREVVNSVMEAERSLSTAIALRDKMVQAYLEVSRMQI
ncbi:flagellar hook-basal body complex protein FliE [Bartonella bovis]|uniref:flagellar hook-basal body complex protein FliE n=1 Tax=Bartonella bovis TaxID=155194 RepID=UPI000C9B49EE|nr:flagellar hook-basal body complex protein FliE [Bartonella bovis]